LLAEYPQHLVLDAGGWAERTNPDRPELRSAILLQGLRELGLQIANVSAPDLALGPEALRDDEDSLGVQFVSANIEVDGKPWFRPYILLHRKLWGREVGIAITGVTVGTHGFDRAWPDSLRPVITDPLASAARMIDLLAPQSDLQVLLAFLPASELDRLATELPQYDLLIGSTGDIRDAPPIGPVPAVLAPGTKCKTLAWVAVRPAASGELVVTRAEVTSLDSHVPDDPQMAERVRTFKEQLGEGLPPADVAGPGHRPDGPSGQAAVHP
jgi:2',3'-cyclic-nucleotide 2'-phosphodiesterase (5'-nucleotidase family)